MYIIWDSGIIRHEPVPTDAVSIFDVGRSGESDELCFLSIVAFLAVVRTVGVWAVITGIGPL